MFNTHLFLYLDLDSPSFKTEQLNLVACTYSLTIPYRDFHAKEKAPHKSMVNERIILSPMAGGISRRPKWGRIKIKFLG